VISEFLSSANSLFIFRHLFSPDWRKGTKPVYNRRKFFQHIVYIFNGIAGIDGKHGGSLGKVGSHTDCYENRRRFKGF
jgi:hypothetical protein